FRVIVVADNCRDRTADLAQAQGAWVWKREDPRLRGKGHALRFAFERSLAEGEADAVVVIDADTRPAGNLLHALADRLSRGQRVIQVENGVLNPEDSWRTQLMAISLAAFNGVRSLGRERLGLSVGLRGNGMCFARSVLQQHPPQAFSVVEDLEYGLQLGRAGIRVHYAPETRVLSVMVPAGRAARSQRLRWERGRGLIRRAHALPLLGEAFRRRRLVLLDLAADLLLPPLTGLALGVLGGLGAASVAAFVGGSPLVLAPWLFALLALALYVLRGWHLSKTGMAGLAALARAPLYAAWKIALRVGGSKDASTNWVRTARDGALTP
ncbi:MAG TPA: glycosyltransferase family 2 protein, partial [Myxococcaceae bacterium]|nr:glycosyltransferase family 2 protein [Myxococcaceae bacterium]